MTQHHPRTYHSLLISTGIHLSLALAAAGILTHSIPPSVPEKVKIKIMIDNLPAQVERTPVSTPPSQPVQTKPSPIIPKPQPIIPPKPLMQPLTPEPIVPTKAAPLIPSPAPVSVATPKLPEPMPIVAPKAVPPPPPSPPPPPKENYVEENIGKIRSILNERKTYPKNAKRLNQQGDVTITFSLSSEGEVSGIVIVESSGFEILDNAAKELIEKSADAFPKPKRSVRITVPIGYNLR